MESFGLNGGSCSSKGLGRKNRFLLLGRQQTVWGFVHPLNANQQGPPFSASACRVGPGSRSGPPIDAAPAHSSVVRRTAVSSLPPCSQTNLLTILAPYGKKPV